MPQADANALARMIRQLEPEVILKAITLCTGHNILDPEALIVAGLPTEVVDQLTATHRSGNDHKSMLYVDGRPVEAVTGVWGLSLLQFVALALQVEYPIKFGRGSQASAIKSAIRSHLSAADVK